MIGNLKANMHKWEKHKLIEHYLKHPSGACKECWSLALQSTQKPISIEEYEIQSLEILQRNWLKFTAWYQKSESKSGMIHQYFVDERFLVTICLSNILKTSYKFHLNEDFHDNEINFSKKLALFNKFKKRESYSLNKMYGFNVHYIETRNLSDQDKLTLNEAKSAFIRVTRSKKIP